MQMVSIQNFSLKQYLRNITSVSGVCVHVVLYLRSCCMQGKACTLYACSAVAHIHNSAPVILRKY